MESIVLVQTSAGYWDHLQGKGLPLSILHASTMIHAKYRVRLVDLRFTLFWRRALRRLVLEEKPILVGITVMIGPQISQAIEISRFVKAISGDTKIVWGGVFPSLNPQLVFTEHSVDFVVFGEGEKTLMNLADAIRQSGSADGVGNVYSRHGGGPAAGFLRLDDLPPLPYELLPSGRYTRRFRDGGVIALETSRGCPHRCRFCYNIGVCGGHWRSRSPDRVREDVRQVLETFGPRKILLIDDNFFANEGRAFEIGEILARAGVRWGTQGLTPSSASRLTQDEIRMLAEQGCDEVKMGIENVSPAIMKQMNKHFDRDGLREFNRAASHAGIRIQYSLVFGFQDETEDDMRDNIDYIFTLLRENRNARLFLINVLFPFPGTEMYLQCRDEAWKRSWTLGRYARYEMNVHAAPWVDEERLRLLRSISFAAMFVTPKMGSPSTPMFKLIERARRLYEPIARHRLKGLHFRFAPEIALGSRAIALVAKYLR